MQHLQKSWPRVFPPSLTIRSEEDAGEERAAQAAALTGAAGIPRDLRN